MMGLYDEGEDNGKADRPRRHYQWPDTRRGRRETSPWSSLSSSSPSSSSSSSSSSASQLRYTKNNESSTRSLPPNSAYKLQLQLRPEGKQKGKEESSSSTRITIAPQTLLTPTAEDTRKIRLLQAWIHDYETLTSQVRALLPLLLVGTRDEGGRSRESGADKDADIKRRVQEILAEAARVEMGPRERFSSSSSSRMVWTPAGADGGGGRRRSGRRRGKRVAAMDESPGSSIHMQGESCRSVAAAAAAVTAGSSFSGRCLRQPGGRFGDEVVGKEDDDDDDDGKRMYLSGDGHDGWVRRRVRGGADDDGSAAEASSMMAQGS